LSIYFIQKIFIFFFVFIEKISYKNIKIFLINILKFNLICAYCFSFFKNRIKIIKKRIYFIIFKIRNIKLSSLSISIRQFICNKFNFLKLIHIARNYLKTSSLSIIINCMWPSYKFIYNNLHRQNKTRLKFINFE